MELESIVEHEARSSALLVHSVSICWTGWQVWPFDIFERTTLNCKQVGCRYVPAKFHEYPSVILNKRERERCANRTDLHTDLLKHSLHKPHNLFLTLKLQIFTCVAFVIEVNSCLQTITYS
jgi:hypothetical protein